jgi:hypothetical protein
MMAFAEMEQHDYQGRKGARAGQCLDGIRLCAFFRHRFRPEF